MFAANEHQDQSKSQENHDQRKYQPIQGIRYRDSTKHKIFIQNKDERACSKRDKGKLTRNSRLTIRRQ